MQDNSFEFTVRVDVGAMKAGAHAGLAMFEESASGLEIVQSGDARRLDFFHLSEHVSGPELSQAVIQLRVRVRGDQALYFYSLD
jgi:hypothetical protein